MSDKPKDVSSYTEWLREKFGGVNEDKESVDTVIAHINCYGLMEEVVEWTKRDMKAGYPFLKAFNMAMREWDL